MSGTYHPESLGALFVLFAIRDTKQESLGFNLAERVFGHNVQGPLNMLTENLLTANTKVLDVVSQCRFFFLL